MFENQLELIISAQDEADEIIDNIFNHYEKQNDPKQIKKMLEMMEIILESVKLH